MKTIIVYWLPVSSVRGKEENILSVLPDKRVEKAKRFVKEDDEALSLAAGYLIARYVGEYYVDPYGKPRSERLFFNLSHSADVAALAVSTSSEVGLDIEKNCEKKDVDDLADYCLNDEEQNEYRNGRPFLSLFTAKESLAKAEGKGLFATAVKKIPSLPLDGEVKYQNKTYHRHTLNKDGYFLSVTSEGGDFEIQTEETYVE